MLQETLHDTGEIVQHILLNPLAVKDFPKPISLLEAAMDSNPEGLMRILQSFLDYPESTDMLLIEIDLLRKELL